MKSQVLLTVWCHISCEAAGEFWHWSLSGVKGLTMIIMLVTVNVSKRMIRNIWVDLVLRWGLFGTKCGILFSAILQLGKHQSCPRVLRHPRWEEHLAPHQRWVVFFVCLLTVAIQERVHGAETQESDTIYCYFIVHLELINWKNIFYGSLSHFCKLTSESQQFCSQQTLIIY